MPSVERMIGMQVPFQGGYAEIVAAECNGTSINLTLRPVLTRIEVIVKLVKPDERGP